MELVVPGIPKYQELLWPALEVLRRLGDSATVQEIESHVYEFCNYSEEQRSVLHGVGPKSEIAYRLAWARSYLKRVGAVENSQRGVWSITERGRSLTQAEMASIPAQVRGMIGHRGRDKPPAVIDDEIPGVGAENGSDNDWREELLEVLLALPPAAFERLSQRLLREQGFVSVIVTGKSGDGGIDGTGILRMKLLSFQMFFQCKRYRGNVGSSAIRDFRGAMVGRSDKGLLITTGRFTAEAMREANRDGAPPIDLVDGEQLCTMLKELNLGVATEQVERVTVDSAWFESF